MAYCKILNFIYDNTRLCSIQDFDKCIGNFLSNELINNNNYFNLAKYQGFIKLTFNIEVYNSF